MVPSPDPSTEQPIMEELVLSCEQRIETLHQCIQAFNRIAIEVGSRS